MVSHICIRPISQKAGKEKPVCSALDGLRALEAALAVRESAASGLEIRLNPA